MDKIKCFKITPSPITDFDHLIVVADDTWGGAIKNVEDALEQQFIDDKEWSNISVTVQCVYKTQEELDELED